MPNYSKDNGYKINVGRPRHKPWEQKVTASFRLTYETYQRIQRLAKREGIIPSKALELLVRTEESEKIEPTQAVDYSKIKQRSTGYSVTNILDKHFK
jgi:hypothetical protein